MSKEELFLKWACPETPKVKWGSLFSNVIIPDPSTQNRNVKKSGQKVDTNPNSRFRTRFDLPLLEGLNSTTVWLRTKCRHNVI